MLNRNLAFALMATLSLSACFDLNKVSYVCENNEKLSVSYSLPTEQHEEATAVLHYKGQKIPMTSRTAASGALYIADDEQNSYRWHTKYESGVLSYLEADHTAEEEILLRDCVSQ